MFILLDNLGQYTVLCFSSQGQVINTDLNVLNRDNEDDDPMIMRIATAATAKVSSERNSCWNFSHRDVIISHMALGIISSISG